jgi:L,D-transpeptidase catalytic domain/Bacterial alpha-L-rhamnosidase C-terminal domain/Bacterial alpha-L-rhamnosidase 6 hairpin glycosidase domain
MLARVGIIFAITVVGLSAGTRAQPEAHHTSTEPLFGFFSGASSFSSSDPLLEQVWNRSVERLARMNDERFRSVLRVAPGPYWGGPAPWYDSVERLNSGHSFLKDALLMVQHPSLIASDGHDPLAAYFLEWPALLKSYWLHTGDNATAEALAEAYLKPWLMYYQERETNGGLLSSANISPPPPSYLQAESDTVLPAGSDAILNAFYYDGIREAAALLDRLGYDASFWYERAAALRAAYREMYFDEEKGLFRDGMGSDVHSVAANALALRFGLADREESNAIIELIRTDAGSCPAAWQPYLIEACFRAGASGLGYDLITFLEDTPYHAAAHGLVSGELFGLNPLSPGWRDVAFAPRLPDHLDRVQMEVDVPGGRVGVRYDGKTGYTVTAPLGTRVLVDMQEGDRVVVRTAQSHTRGTLTTEQQAFLESQDWAEQVGGDMGIWIDIDTQMMRIVRGTQVLYQARCASSASGVGSLMDSLKTPLGWHSVAKKIGDDAPWGQVFRARRATREVWQVGEDTKEDLVLTRILLLTGEEPGVNKGGRVDSFARNIYIHGTNDEARIGTPSSHGCIRLTNDDVIETYAMVPAGTKVLLTATHTE